MTFSRLTDILIDLVQRYPLPAAAIALLLLLIAWRKPKETFKFAVFLLFMAAVFYAIGLFRDTLTSGTRSSNLGIEKSEKLEQ